MTDHAATLIAAILLTEYNDDAAPVTEIEDWAFQPITTFDNANQGAGAMARAVDAGLIWHWADGEDSTCGITAEGWAAFTARFGACSEDSYPAYTALARSALRSIRNA
jgi:hypothetical protein